MKLYVALFIIGFIYDLQFIWFLHMAQAGNIAGAAILTFVFYGGYDIVWMRAVKSEYTMKAAVVHALGYACGVVVSLLMFPLKP